MLCAICWLVCSFRCKIESNWGNWDYNFRSFSSRYFLRCRCNLQVCDYTAHSQFSCACYHLEYPQLCLTITLLQKVQWRRMGKYHFQSQWLQFVQRLARLDTCVFVASGVLTCAAVVYSEQFDFNITSYTALNTETTWICVVINQQEEKTVCWCHLKNMYGILKCVIPVVCSN